MIFGSFWTRGASLSARIGPKTFVLVKLMSTIDCESFVIIRQDFRPKNLIFQYLRIDDQGSLNWPITTSEPKIEILISPGTLECSDHLHTVSTCETHEYYRLREFQNRPTTFHHKNRDFEGGAGSKLKCAITTSEPKIEVLDSPGTLECSDHLHTVSTCGFG